MTSWEDIFTAWSKGPSTTETEKCENAERMIKRAIQTSTSLAAFDIRVFAQGSYAVRTNVRLDSDVDICACLQSTFFYDLPEGGVPQAYGIVPSTLKFSDYKKSVGSALIGAFGKDSITPGNKAFDVHENTYRVDADVVPAFEYRRYSAPDKFVSGIEFIADDGKKTINWPEQTYNNGILKNDRTSRRYKRVIRILKRLRNEMQDKGISEAKDIASFLIECLVWNTPDSYFNYTDYTSIVRATLAHLIVSTETQDKCNEWGEVNELQYLFRDGIKPWTRDQAHDFLLTAWIYLGFS